MGAALLAAACAERDVPIQVTSAGFLFTDRPASDTTTKVMRGAGHDVSAHRSRVVDAAILAGADLVLTMERRHARDLVLDLSPAAPVHTMKGFAALATATLADGVPDDVAGDLRAFVHAVDASRPPHALVGDARPDEIADPHGRSARLHRKTADELRLVAAQIADALAAVRGAA